MVRVTTKAFLLYITSTWKCIVFGITISLILFVVITAGLRNSEESAFLTTMSFL